MRHTPARSRAGLDRLDLRGARDFSLPACGEGPGRGGTPTGAAASSTRGTLPRSPTPSRMRGEGSQAAPSARSACLEHPANRQAVAAPTRVLAARLMAATTLGTALATALTTAALAALAAALSLTPLSALAAPPASSLTTLATTTASTESPGTTDPLNSPRWDELRRAWLGDAPAEFDSRVQVQAPAMAEDALNVPVRVDASRLRGQGVEEILILADFNPIVRALSYSPGSAEPVLGFRLKLQQSSPVRAAVRTADGRWHVGGTWVATTGGGCTLPSTGSGSPEWQRQLNHTELRAWPRVDGGQRLKLRIVHPMDTGLADGIPAFHLEEISLLGQGTPAGAALAVLRPYEPVAENPVFTLDLPAGVVASGVSGRDNNGNRLTAELRP